MIINAWIDGEVEQEIAIKTRENADIKGEDEGGDEFLQYNNGDKEKQAEFTPANNYKNVSNHSRRHWGDDTVPTEKSLGEKISRRVLYGVHSEFLYSFLSFFFRFNFSIFRC